VGRKKLKMGTALGNLRRLSELVYWIFLFQRIPVNTAESSDGARRGRELPRGGALVPAESTLPGLCLGIPYQS